MSAPKNQQELAELIHASLMAVVPLDPARYVSNDDGEAPEGYTFHSRAIAEEAARSALECLTADGPGSLEPSRADLLAAIDSHHKDFCRVKALVRDALQDPVPPPWRYLEAIDKIVRDCPEQADGDV